jgi:lipopolysaccharide transport system permease protein
MATISDKAQDNILILRPSRGWGSLNLRDLWIYRELIYFFLTWRDIKVRYKQTALGASWAILQPVLAMIVFTIFFGGLLNVSSGDVPYPIFRTQLFCPGIYLPNH